MDFGRDLATPEILAGGVRALLAVGMAIGIWRIARRMPWPLPFRLRFVASHVAAWLTCAFAWCLLSNATLALLGASVSVSLLDGVSEYLLLSAFIYAFVAGPTYAAEAATRAATAEADRARAADAASRSQMAALRAQLHPHFLFNGLHTVIQLIPVDPTRAADAAEKVAGLLRVCLEEQRDEVALADEWRFVSEYLSIEQLRYGDRLRLLARLPQELLDVRVPSFALQTLVENAVQHGVALRAAPTDIAISATADSGRVTIVVRNTGDGVGATAASGAGVGSGLTRLRARLAVLYGETATLAAGPQSDGGFQAVLVVPSTNGSPT